MRSIASWLLQCVEWTLLGAGLGFLGIYGYQSVEARRFQAGQTAAFERTSRAHAAASERAAALEQPGAEHWAAFDDAALPPAAPVRVRAGGLVGMLDVPRLRLSTPVIEGDDDRTLKKSVGHLPDTPMPWEEGNSAIAGHRDGLFRPLKDVKVGDELWIRTTRDQLRYRVTETTIVMPDDLSVLDPRDGASLTLITCYPFYYVGSAPQRFVVFATRQ